MNSDAGDGPLGGSSDLESVHGRPDEEGWGTGSGEGSLPPRDLPLGRRNEDSEGGLGDGALPCSRSRLVFSGGT